MHNIHINSMLLSFIKKLDILFLFNTYKYIGKLYKMSHLYMQNNYNHYYILNLCNFKQCLTF